jgi:hypothetical protein
MEHWGPDGPLTGGRVAVRRPDDGCKVVAGRKLFEGGTQAQRGGEQGWVRWRPSEASAFYRGQREVAVATKGRAAAVNGALHYCHYHE